MFIYEKIEKHVGTRKEDKIMAKEIHTVLFWLVAIYNLEQGPKWMKLAWRNGVDALKRA